MRFEPNRAHNTTTEFTRPSAADTEQTLTNTFTFEGSTNVAIDTQMWPVCIRRVSSCLSLD